jgi:nondiscriminating glutamyl-tRNA synthetase
MTSSNKPVRVRFAPSPTGYVHLGNIRSALFNYVFARKHGGSFIIRIEDTDQEREVPGSDRDILQVLSWLGLNWNEGPRVGGPKGPYYQTQRLETYSRYARALLDRGLAYYDFGQAPDKDKLETPKEIVWESPDRHLPADEVNRRIEAGESHCIRMHVDPAKYADRKVKFRDVVRGDIVKDVEDFVIVKTNGIPTYHFAVVIDDHHMEISHVIRGIGHLDNTAKHKVLYDAFSWEPPIWAHHSNTAGLSKRKGSPSIGDYMRKGYLPEAIGNVCMLMGWFPKDKEELFSFEARIDEFTLEGLSKADVGNFPKDKFPHICHHHMEQADSARILNLARPFLETMGFIAKDDPEKESNPSSGRIPDSPERIRLLKIIDCVKGKMICAADIVDHVWPFANEIAFDDDSKAQITGEDPQLALKITRDFFLEMVPEGELFDAAAFKAVTKAASKSAPLKEKKIKGKGYFHPLRAALTGRLAGPDLATLSDIVGRDVILQRLNNAIKED